MLPTPPKLCAHFSWLSARWLPCTGTAGIIGAGTNNARLAGMLRALSSYYYKEPTMLFLVRVAQGLVHMGKGLLTLNPYHTDGQLLSGGCTQQSQPAGPPEPCCCAGKRQPGRCRRQLVTAWTPAAMLGSHLGLCRVLLRQAVISCEHQLSDAMTHVLAVQQPLNTPCSLCGAS